MTDCNKRWMHCAFDISVIVFVIDSIPTETEKTGALFTPGKKRYDKKRILPSYQPSARVVLGNRGRASTNRAPQEDWSQQGPYKNRPKVNISSTALRLVSTFRSPYMVLARPSLFWFCRLSKTKSIQLMGNGPYGEMPTKKEPIKSIGFPSRLPCHIINSLMYIPSVICNS